MSGLMNSIKRWYTNWTADNEDKHDLEYKKGIYQLSQEQLAVEVETQKTLEITVAAFRKNLEEQRKKEEQLQELRDNLEAEVEVQNEIYEATLANGGEKNEEYEKKYAYTMTYLNETIPASQRSIRLKIEAYEHKIAHLEGKIQDLIAARVETQNTSTVIGESVREMENARRQDGFLEQEEDNVRLLEQGGEGLGVMIKSPADYNIEDITVQTQPQRTPVLMDNLETV